MPTIAMFYGILIQMYFRDHHPPHFHAIYGEHNAEVSIDPIEVIEGSLPARAERLVFEWAAIHKDTLLSYWQRAREHKDLPKLPPLP